MYSEKQHFDDVELEREETKILKCHCYAAYAGGNGYEDRHAKAGGTVTFKFTSEYEPNFFEVRIKAPVGTYEVGKIYDIPTQRAKYKRAPIPKHDETYWTLEVVKEKVEKTRRK